MSSVMPSGVMARLGKFGYAVGDTPPTSAVCDVASIHNLCKRIFALPGVSNDPLTHGAIEALIELEFGNGEDFGTDDGDSPEESQERRRDRGVERGPGGKPIQDVPGF